MRGIKLSLAACISATLFSSMSADTLSEALKNGKVSGDVSIRYESRKQDKEISTYYSDTAYSVGSIGLNYKTATFNNFSADIGFRTYAVLHENDKDFVTKHGTGDATERFYDEKGLTALSKAYLQYKIPSVDIKVGRQNISTDWITKLHDAVSINAKPFTNANLELIWTKKRGRTTVKDLRPMKTINNGDGVYKVAFSYKLANVTLKPYFLSAPNSYDMYGGKVSFETKSFGLLAHAMQTKEENNSADGEMIELKTYAKLAGYKATLGYVELGEDNGWGSADSIGEKVVPFEEGDQMYVKDSKTYYFQLNKKFADLSLTALYGITKYQQFEKDELNIWAGYKINKEMKLSLGYAMTNEDKKDASTTDLQQLNATLSYKF